jgi:hypothetical protein
MDMPCSTNGGEVSMRDAFISDLADMFVAERLTDHDISERNFSIAPSRDEIIERARRDLHVEQPLRSIIKNKLISNPEEKPLIEWKLCGRKHDLVHCTAEGKECFLCIKKGEFQKMCQSSNDHKTISTRSFNENVVKC